MFKIAHLARLSLLLCLLVGCAPTAAPEQPTVSGGYEFTVQIAPRTNPDGSPGSAMTVVVRPPDPSDPEQVAVARAMEQEFLKRMRAQLDTGSRFLEPGLPTEAEQPH